jgi:hypothetical protein
MRKRAALPPFFFGARKISRVSGRSCGVALQFPAGQQLNPRSSLDFCDARLAACHFLRNEKIFL